MLWWWSRWCLRPQFIKNFQIFWWEAHIDAWWSLLCEALNAHVVHPKIILKELITLKIVDLLDKVACRLLRISMNQGLNGVWDLWVADTAPNIVKYVFDVLQACCLYWLKIGVQASFHYSDQLRIHLYQLLHDLWVPDLSLASRKSIVLKYWLHIPKVSA